MKYLLSLFFVLTLTLPSFGQNQSVIDDLKKSYKDVKVHSNHITAKDKKTNEYCTFLPDGSLLFRDKFQTCITNEQIYGGKKYYMIAYPDSNLKVALVDENGNKIISYPQNVKFIENAPRQVFVHVMHCGPNRDTYDHTDVIAPDGTLLFKSAVSEYLEPLNDKDHLYFIGKYKSDKLYYRLLDSSGKILIPWDDLSISSHKFGGKYYFSTIRKMPDSESITKFALLYDETGNLLPGIRSNNWYIELDGEVFFILHKINKGFNGKIEKGDSFVYSPTYGEIMPWTDDDKNLALRSENGNKMLVKTSSAGDEHKVALGKAAIAQPQQQVAQSRPAPTPAPKENQTPAPVAKPALTEIDSRIPKGNSTHPHTFALIIANENYRREEKVPYAINDGEIFASYLKNTLGVPEKNIQLYTDASLNDIKYGINRLAQICDAFGSDASVIVYYAGHGIPDEKSLDAHLLPVDGYGSDPSTGYSLNSLYNALSSLPAKQTVLLLDACFSGSQRSGKMMASNARGVRLKPKETQAGGNLIVLSATQGDETAYPYEDHGHGMFTYFVLKKLNENKGNVTLGELSDYVITNVKRASVINNEKIQTPTVTASPALSSTWKSINFGE